MVVAGGCTGGGAASSGSHSPGNSGIPALSSNATPVPGENYQICTEPRYLTSPWTYNALAAGHQSYTVAQYEALAGYGKTLPPLPAYIAQENPATAAAIIYAPGSSAITQAFQLPETPILQFFEGGAYGEIAMQSVSGDEFIGGSAPGYPEPAFDDGGKDGGITAQNDTFSYSGGTSALASPAKAGATAISTSAAIANNPSYVTFADGTTYQVAASHGASISLSSKLTKAEPAGAAVWGGNTPPIASTASPAAQGATGISLTTSAVPLVPDGRIVIGTDNYLITGVSGTQSSYQVTVAGLDTAAGAGVPVFYDGLAGHVAVEYLNISHDRHSTQGTIYTGSGWTITHNDIHDGNGAPGLGVAISNGDRSTIEYNCLSKMGDYGLNIGGVNDVFDFNEIYDTNYNKDPGCGCSGGGKWWGTLNADIVDNAFIDDGPGGSSPIWLDNGNSGTLIQGNYFARNYAASITSETGYNLKITGNLFVDSGWGSGNGACGPNCGGAVNLNTSGGFSVPGSRFENSVVISGNQFINDWMGVDVWQSGERSCENSGESGPGDGTDDPYCSGGYPTTASAASGGQYYFSHIGDARHGGGTTVLAQPAAAGSTQLLVQGAEAVTDQVGFANPATTSTQHRGTVGAFNGGTSVLPANTAGFPSAGELRVGTSAAWGDHQGSYTGAILAYRGTSSSGFTGVSLLRGSGSLSGPVEEVQPYQVTAERCFANDCLVTITPALATAQPAGATVANTGTCQLFATSAALPSGPLAPDHVSYWDGCQWEARDISVTGNSFTFQPSAIASGSPLAGGSSTSCTADHHNGCGTNFMGFQDAGEAPFSSQIGGNAMMSQSGLTGCPAWDPGCHSNPLSNINALASPPNAVAGNGESPYNNIWSGNKYYGPWAWNVYLFGTCSPLPTDPATGKQMPSAACSPDFSQWQGIWQQDANSSFSPKL
jgi:hypothetical protein